MQPRVTCSLVDAAKNVVMYLLFPTPSGYAKMLLWHRIQYFYDHIEKEMQKPLHAYPTGRRWNMTVQATETYMHSHKHALGI
eukprot:2992958-Amphidinium_carterae.1